MGGFLPQFVGHCGANGGILLRFGGHLAQNLGHFAPVAGGGAWPRHWISPCLKVTNGLSFYTLVSSDVEFSPTGRDPLTSYIITLMLPWFIQGCDCAANWLILANSDPNFVISEISVNQVRKCFPA